MHFDKKDLQIWAASLITIGIVAIYRIICETWSLVWNPSCNGLAASLP